MNLFPLPEQLDPVELANLCYMENRGFRGFRVRWEVDWDKLSGEPTFHKKFPGMAKKLGFRVYGRGWPDFLIEKDGKYMGVGAKEEGGLDDHQWLTHQALVRAGLRVIVITPDAVHLLDNFCWGRCPHNV